jgi:O-acetyl-ADP-ribose deacetylase (regulator of RNase III)
VACKAYGRCAVGDVKVTLGFNLPAKYVFHAVGPRWQGGGVGEAKALASCYFRAMQLASDLAIRSIAFPALSCGIYRYPPADAAKIAIETVSAALTTSCVQTVIFTIIEPQLLEIYTNLIR